MESSLTEVKEALLLGPYSTVYRTFEKNLIKNPSEWPCQGVVHKSPYKRGLFQTGRSSFLNASHNIPSSYDMSNIIEHR